MRLTRLSDIGFRVLIYPERAGRQLDIPPDDMVKVVGRLAKLGWTQSMRGCNGGLRKPKAAREHRSPRRYSRAAYDPAYPALTFNAAPAAYPRTGS